MNLIHQIPHWILWTIAIFGLCAAVVWYTIWSDTRKYGRWRKEQARTHGPFDPAEPPPAAPREPNVLDPRP